MPRHAAVAASRWSTTARPTLLLLMLLSLLPLLVQAQDSTTTTATAVEKPKGIRRSGFYGSFGFGGGEQRFSVDLGGGASQSATQSGGAAMFRLGAALSPRWLLSADLFGFIPERATENESTSGLFATATYVPRIGGGLLLRGGIGMLYNEVDASPGLILTNRDAAIQLGLGYDIKVGRNKAISLSADLLQGIRENDGSQRLALLGAAFNIY